ncbi:MAG: hypothetical protein MK207_09495 [Saprospiraceae bacterium]|nr:hypothetical protein [Saprospiraceae bacterium]
MKNLIFIFLFCLLYAKIFACSAAYQYSLFPLGKSMGQLIILELELNRYISTPENQIMEMGAGTFNNNIEVRWKGSIKLYQMEMNKLVLYTDLGSIDLLDDDYYEAMLPFFKKAYNIASKMPMYEEAILENSGICHYDRTCDFITLTIDEENAAFYTSSNEKGYENKKCSVPFSMETLQKVENTTKIKFTDFKNIDKEYQIDFFKLWSPQSVRRYNIGEQTIQVYTIGRGDKSRYIKTKNNKWERPNLESIAYYIQGNDVLYHGQRFDFIQIL